MKQNVTLSNGRIVTHRPYHNGATEAFMLDGGNMSNSEWLEYVNLTSPMPKKKLTWKDIKKDTYKITFDPAIPGQDKTV